MGIRRALTHNQAATGADAEDPRLRGRSYVIPFRDVWRAAVWLAGSLPGWRVVESDPVRGEIRAEATTRVWKFVDDVAIRITLDETGATRVDLRSASRVGRGDLGTNARRIRSFLRRLDRALGAPG